MDIVNADDGSGRLFVAETDGEVKLVENGAVAPQLFLDIPDLSCQGLLSLAFSPDYASSGRFYVAHQTDGCGDLLIARYQVSADPNVADPSSREVILRVPVPVLDMGDHVGSKLVFGPDGYLYISVGDGQFSFDPGDQAQDPSTLLGKILRIDVEDQGPEPYTIPPSNPFVGDPNKLPEIWALGLRNPWRTHFDSETGDLFIGDVGQFQVEEINLQPSSSTGGENYGWPIMEGSSCYDAPSCDTSGITLPVTEYGHSQGDCSVTAGVMSRAPQAPGLNGVFFYGDWCSGRLWGLREAESWESSLLLDTDLAIVGFGQDEDGNVWVADYWGEAIYQISQDCGPNPCDHDEDTVPDAEDPCPTSSGPAGSNGCPPRDTDNDGVVDGADGCPTTPGPSSNNGCPVAPQAPGETGPSSIPCSSEYDICGTDGSDTFFLTGGDDANGDGITSLWLGSGDDVVCIDPGAGIAFEVDAGPGNDKVIVGSAELCGAASRKSGAPVEASSRRSEAETSKLLADGGSGVDLLVGGEGEDLLRGGRGNDRLIGQGGDDVLIGDAGDDRLRGAGGNDRLQGRGGRDRLVGGAGVDSCRGNPRRDRTRACEGV